MKIFSLLGYRHLLSYLIYFSLFLCIPLSHAAAIDDRSDQDRDITVSGFVTFQKMPMQGVSIIAKGSGSSAISDADGRYSLTVRIGEVLVVSFIGFKTIEHPVSGLSSISFELEEAVTALNEVTVNAGYYTVKESQRTGSIAKVSSKDIEKQPVTNFLASIQGRMAGVSVTQESGVAGGGFAIQIRGINSLRRDGNAPLYVIDGVPYSSDPIGSAQTSTVLPNLTSPLTNINPADIESIEILKDADATAIYGSRGANGVVLVTTKKGKAGKTRFSASAASGWGHVTRYMDLMDTQQYLSMRRQAFENDGITEYPADAYDVNGTWDPSRYTDWQKELYGGTSQIRSFQSSVSGGSEHTQFLISGNYHSETTVFPGDFLYRKGDVHFNISHASDDRRFKASLSGSYTSQNNRQPWSDLTPVAITLAPNAPSLYDAAGNLNWENGTFTNPLGALAAGYGTKSGNLVSNMLLSYRLLEGLEFKSSFGFTDLNFTETRTMPSTMYDPAFGVTSASSSLFFNNVQRQSWIVEPQLNYQRAFGRVKTELLLGTTFQNQTGARLVERGFGFASNSLIHNLAAANIHIVYGNEQSVYRYQAFFGRVNLNWEDKYILNATARRDGSSRFGPGRQFATFGAIGAAWVFSKEDGLKDNATFLSFGKLRASYGTTGNDQIGDYQYLDTYSLSGHSYQGMGGLEPTRLFNPNFGWESNTKAEMALETGFLDDRIFLTTAYYTNRSSNQLVGLPLPGTTGFNSLQANLDATVENSGLEMTLRTTNIKGRDFNWTTSFNISFLKNRLVSFPGLESSPYANQYVIGQSVNIRKLFQSTGVDPQTGLYGFTDFNGDGVISAPDDRQVTRDLSPEYFGGLQNSFSYKGLAIDFLFQFVKQQNYSSATVLGFPGAPSNNASEVSHSWQQPGDNAPFQQFSTGLNGDAVVAFYNYLESDRAITDASYIRLKNVAITYELPKKWTGVLGCKLSVQGQNLLLFTKYRGADPEFVSSGFLPPLRVITAGIQLTL
ncbi:SusC/RagA family TonB-linked outer membrane protein [Flavobacterium macacae]|uniref:SusC/RagA family TonB-linked outer membrane protein n=1 Tax=Flavobacterium macacae TaxID=2488993 RepID=A0A3P3W8U0_9FLAO|nr:SusC/RagA family TonB-linked outer membrane protein [Flavobacterium macacae]RRJ90757.1 SusC/RagA family TonB-linked outer membrane protein [Flavobacterium macacae]